MRAEAIENEEADKKNLEKIQKMNEADAIIFQTEKSIKDLEEKIQEEEKTSIESILGALKEARKEEDVEKIESLLNDLTASMQKITERIYSETQSSEPGNEGTTVSEDDMVQFEEVQ
jgi:molecular chaperone DnaK